MNTTGSLLIEQSVFISYSSVDRDLASDAGYVTFQMAEVAIPQNCFGRFWRGLLGCERRFRHRDDDTMFVESMGGWLGWRASSAKKPPNG